MTDSEGGDHTFSDNMGGIQTMGILNALKTGDPRLDMILAMCLPFAIRFLFDLVGRLEVFCRFDYWRQWWESRTVMHQRCITYQRTRNHWGECTSLDPDSQNTILLKAIQLFLHTNVKLDLKAAGINLTSTEDKHSSLGGYNDFDSEDESDDRRTVVGILSKYKIIKDPPANTWHKLGSYGDPSAVVELHISNHEEDLGDGKKKKDVRTFTFRSTDGRAIDAFVDSAFDWYMAELRRLEDHSRYLYELKSTNTISASSADDEGDSRSQGTVYKRYKLSNEKTFESLFFREKTNLLNLIQHFRNRSGKYAVKGYPHKLGVLLHGPPGSGKTSLIKALAQHTGRSIVNVPLARIATNAELQSIFFDNTYNIQGQCVPIKLGYKDIIFVMEDVDAASKVVKRRDGKNTVSTVLPGRDELPTPQSMWHMLVQSSESECQELVKILMEKSERLKKETQKPELLHAMARRMMILPELGLVGEVGDNEILQQIGKEAVDSAESLMNHYSIVDQFVTVHAKTIKKLLDSGAEVDHAFVEALLGNQGPPTLPLLVKPTMCREISSDSIQLHKQLLEAHVFSQTSLGDTDSDSTNGAGKAKAKSAFDVMGPSSWIKVGADTLNLTGILNVLDGVVDTPGR